MLSPKMQRTVRVNESQLLMLSEKARYDHSISGYLHKRTSDSTKWQSRWFVLYQNVLFYYENESYSRPSGIILLEGCYCERIIASKSKELDKQHCFAISYRRENLRQYELKALTETSCKMWIEAICEASFNKVLLQKEELEQKHLHLLQIVETEKTAKWQYTQQCEDLASEIKKLRAELCALKKELRPSSVSMGSAAVAASFTGYGMRRHSIQKNFSQCICNCNNNNNNTRAASATTATTTQVSSLLSANSEFECGNNSSTNGGGGVSRHCFKEISEGSIEMQKIKKVQSFFRGWLCRRRWKQIVEQYIKSPHAESMRKRNSLVFQMVEAEEEYTEQMEILVSCFLRPFKMAASSKKPPCSHEDVNSIFLNSETVLFLHQIFLKGLTSRMESWPTLVLGDLFDMLLPMLSIYQEYVRNHHYSLQVLTECKQSSSSFAALLNRLEKKSACHGRSLVTFLTYPMNQIPRYIVTLHELLAHTPHDHVERKSLQNARQQLEQLSRQMHDEVSETENLRKNLAVERMIIEGCDILLDVNQVFVRQGALMQVLEKANHRGTRRKKSSTFGVKNISDKEAIRQCFLFSNHLILATRQSDDDGRLNLVPQIGKIPLCDAVLIEDPSDQTATTDDDVSSGGISESSGSGSGGGGYSGQIQNRDFKIILDLKAAGGQVAVHLVAPTVQEKAAWISDISQCMDNVRFNEFLHSSLSETSSVSMPRSIRNDPKLFKDDVDIRFSRTLNSCKVPQIRYATPDRILQRLTDLRFLSIDFLNTFLLTYRVFTDGVTVLEALKKVFNDAEPPDAPQIYPNNNVGTANLFSIGNNHQSQQQQQQLCEDDCIKSNNFKTPRRQSGASSVSGYGSEISECGKSEMPKSHAGYLELSSAMDTTTNAEGTNANSTLIALKSSHHYCSGFYKLKENEQEYRNIQQSIKIDQSRAPIIDIRSDQSSQQSLSNNEIQEEPTIFMDKLGKCTSTATDDLVYLKIPKVIAVSSSAETLTDNTVVSAPSSPSNLSSVTLVGSTGSGSGSDLNTQRGDIDKTWSRGISDETITKDAPPMLEMEKVQSKADERIVYEDLPEPQHVTTTTTAIASGASTRSGSFSTTFSGNYWSGRRSIPENEIYTSSSQQCSVQHDTQQASSKAGVVITSFRPDRRRNSNSTAATAFAIATSASSNPPDRVHERRHHIINDGSSSSNRVCAGSCKEKSKRKESVMSTAATMRILNVLGHWVSKHAQDFELDSQLNQLTIEFLKDITYSSNLLPSEHKAANRILRLLTIKEEMDDSKIDLTQLLAPPTIHTKENIETLSALEIAEQMTYLDHRIFVSIASEEFLSQAWMKADKATRAPHVTLMTKRFNHVSLLVVSEIVRRTSMSARVAAIEKWTAVADISRVLRNYNGVLQICAAFTNSSVYRLKKTWEKVSKTTKQTIERLQIIVSSDCRFRNLRDALHRCDPPCIPYLGIYLTDLSFIEEGTPNFTEDGLLNFSKMRMVAHVIREIRHFQQTPYKIELIKKVTNYLLDPSLLLDEDEMYSMSLTIEPRTSRLSNVGLTNLYTSLITSSTISTTTSTISTTIKSNNNQHLSSV
ncbi:ras-specific guanine nucleotide-releasing factor 2-like isoform X2 [Leptopilina heterotoma]|uniref:ras-specific guanine nucleotide-releasing factor 2-like isoform X2 n=1 Tax=Leptopilina heterotoma TaxID=63436 RepID=UPI001CA8022D|nr:ras-specific guanine nucleotide-releasing factor 2-like isoform X2 [Leptopilina heterotoma]